MWALVFCILFFHMICVVYFLWGTFALCKQRKKDGFLCFPLSFFGGKKAPSLPFSFFPPISLTFGKVLHKTDFPFYLRRKIQFSLAPPPKAVVYAQFYKVFPRFPLSLILYGKAGYENCPTSLGRQKEEKKRAIVVDVT